MVSENLKLLIVELLLLQVTLQFLIYWKFTSIFFNLLAPYSHALMLLELGSGFGKLYLKGGRICCDYVFLFVFFSL